MLSPFPSPSSPPPESQSREMAITLGRAKFASRFSRIRYVRLAFLLVTSHLRNVLEKEKYIYICLCFNLCQRIPLENLSGLVGTEEFGDCEEMKN